MAASAPQGSAAPATAISQTYLDRIKLEATSRWVSLLPLSQRTAARTLLNSLTFQFPEMGGSTLAELNGNTIRIDANAAGWGWFVDSSPENDRFIRSSGRRFPGELRLRSIS
jgi:hypothetical protein